MRPFYMFHVALRLLTLLPSGLIHANNTFAHFDKISFTYFVVVCFPLLCCCDVCLHAGSQGSCDVGHNCEGGELTSVVTNCCPFS